MEVCIGPRRKRAVIIHGVHTKRIVLNEKTLQEGGGLLYGLIYLHRVLQEHTDKTINLLLLRCFETMTNLIDCRFHAKN
jgi:hypothetical protein